MFFKRLFYWLIPLHKFKSFADLGRLCQTPDRLASYMQFQTRYVSDLKKHGVAHKVETEEEILAGDAQFDCDEYAHIAYGALKVMDEVTDVFLISVKKGSKGHRVATYKYKNCMYHLSNWTIKGHIRPFKCPDAENFIGVGLEVYNNPDRIYLHGVVNGKVYGSQIFEMVQAGESFNNVA